MTAPAALSSNVLLTESLAPNGWEPGGFPAFVAEEHQYQGSVIVMDPTSGDYTKAPNGGAGQVAGRAKFEIDNTGGIAPTAAQVPIPGVYTLPQDGTITGPKFYLLGGYMLNDNCVTATSGGSAYPGGLPYVTILGIPSIQDPTDPEQFILDTTRVVVKLGVY